jgi:glycosyltransferase involved in cell wall biosynthesis
MNLSVIVPVYNEAENITHVIAEIKKVPIQKEIIVVDDYSTDGTRQKLGKIKGIKSVSHQKNQGKGAAIRSGLSIASGDYVIIQDADLEYSPCQYVNLIEPLKHRSRKVIYGSRLLGNGTFLPMSYFANRVLTLLTNILYSAHITDMETCYKLIETQFMKSLNLVSSRFEIEPEITCKILRCKEPIFEVPITYNARKKGKKIGPKDGIQALWNLIKWKFKT